MSQLLTPINGGIVPEIQTSIVGARLNVLSPQYIEVKKLQDRLTEWVAGGRPIYRRLPAASETYQINFFNVVNDSNISGFSSANKGLEEVGYVYIPYGQGLDGPTSSQVISSESNQDLLIKAGEIIWKYGKTQTLPTIVNLPVLNLYPGKYTVAYQLIFDDAPVQKLYAVDDFILTGLPLDITASTDDVIGWRYPAVNAFLNTENNFWVNRDTLFPSYADPSFTPGYQPFLQWESTLGQAYSKIVLRCPANTAYTGTANLSFVTGSFLSPVTSVSIQADATGQYFEFEIEQPNFETGWNITFSDPTISIQSVTVSGVVTLLEKPAGPSPRAALVIYPTGKLPVPATYCQLADVDVGVDNYILKIQDTREIIHRDYTPVADWLTLPFDEELIDLYEQTSNYASLWMAPPDALGFEYEELETDQIIVTK